MSFIKNFAKNFILRSDMFAAQPTMRLGGQSSYETMFGGCLSILLVTAFAVIFSKSFITVINKVNVSASLNLEDNPYDDTEINDIRMAIGILGLDFSDSQRYFNIILKVTSMPLGGMPTQTQIELTSCNQADWENLGDNFSKLFSVYNMSRMLCPSATENLTIKGFQGSSQWVTMSIYVEQCRNMSSVNWTCYPPMDIKTKFETYLLARDFLKVSFLLLNTVISPQQEDATKSVLQNQIFITFSNTSGSRSQLKLGRYEVTTDNSIWPVSDESSEEGYYLASHETYSINLYSTHYVRIQIEKARSVYQVSRTHDKLDQMLSYAGGLFSLLFGALFFFLGSYNQYKYEIAVAEHAFAIDETGRKVKEGDFGFWTYLKYCLYDWMRTFGLCCSWKRMQQIDSAKEQACQQMDIRYLMKKLQHYELINKLLLGQHNLMMINLSRPPTLEQVKRIRKINQYYDKVIKVENEENMLSKIIGMSQVVNQRELRAKDEKLQQVQGHKFQDDISLDSEDQQIEKQIADVYKQHRHNDPKNDPLATKILQNMPQSIKDRLSSIQSSQNSGNALIEKHKLRVQSSFSIGQATPNTFLPGLMTPHR